MSSPWELCKQCEQPITKNHQCWNTQDVVTMFDIQSFMAPYVVVVRRSDKVKGTLQFTHMPRWYFDFQPT